MAQESLPGRISAQLKFLAGDRGTAHQPAVDTAGEGGAVGRKAPTRAHSDGVVCGGVVGGGGDGIVGGLHDQLFEYLDLVCLGILT